ncbi:CheR family methyltransferase [Streptomyces sp. NPDC059070]|uniref:CheR family methyltransferase n=1 Tax=Streptomyces sp. NPDC059070 TaxID=3346713 RepID=UPI0036C3945F
MGEGRYTGNGRSRPERAALVRLLRDSGEVDVGCYKPVLLDRQMEVRMSVLGISSPAAYHRLLVTSGAEREVLAHRLFVGVTSFFRDPDAWEFLRSAVLAGLLARDGGGREIRVWSAGCCTGQEAYSLAIALAEALDPQEYLRRVKIFATDADHEAVQAARSGLYDEQELGELPAGLRAKYFVRQGRMLCFRPDLRPAVVFGRHDLVHDVPLSRIDLLVCRNTLLYFSPQARDRITDGFHFALREGGFLFLGNAELLLNRRDQFELVHPRRHVYRRRPDRGGPPRARKVPLPGVPVRPVTQGHSVHTGRAPR